MATGQRMPIKATVDAGIAALFMACVCEPVLSSPGGGGFATILVDGRPVVLDFFVSAPSHKQPESNLDFREVFADFGTTTQGFHIGAGATAVPGFLPGLFALHERFGQVPMHVLAQPAIAAAREGVTVTEFQAFLAHVVSPILLATPQARAVFGDARGQALSAGAHFQNPALADALDAITHEGLRIATHGEIAAAMLSVSGENAGGHLRPEDLEGYEPIWRAPLECAVAGVQQSHRFLTNPPPSLGGALTSLMLTTLEHSQNERRGSEGYTDRARAIDAVDRFWREDPQNTQRLVERMGRQSPPAPSGGLATRGTTHLSVIDRQGSAIAITVSNGEGNGALTPGCGFMPNNMLGEEDVNPRGFHQWGPGHRMASMMAPSLVTGSDGAVTALGSGGSNRIRTAIFQVTASHVLDGLLLDEAVRLPRVHCEKGFLDIEGGVPEGDLEALKTAFPDHRHWEGQSLYFGGVHALSRGGKGAIDGAGDPRRAGVFIKV
jgi:gamma-glutamyltranspeptidase/glutathione hydrolase